MNSKKVLALSLSGLLAIAPLGNFTGKTASPAFGSVAYADASKNKEEDLKRLRESLEDLKVNNKALELIKQVAPDIYKNHKKGFDDIAKSLNDQITKTEQAIKLLTETKTDTETKPGKKEGNTKGTLGPNDERIVDGQRKLKINSVTATDERNEFAESNPAQVVIVDYTYTNIGYEGDIMDGLFLTPSIVVDGNGNVAQLYPATSVNNPQVAPVGATMNNAQEAFGLREKSDKVRVTFSTYDGNDKEQKVTFEVPVQ